MGADREREKDIKRERGKEKEKIEGLFERNEKYRENEEKKEGLDRGKDTLRERERERERERRERDRERETDRQTDRERIAQIASSCMVYLRSIDKETNQNATCDKFNLKLFQIILQALSPSNMAQGKTASFLTILSCFKYPCLSNPWIGILLH